MFARQNYGGLDVGCTLVLYTTTGLSNDCSRNIFPTEHNVKEKMTKMEW